MKGLPECPKKAQAICKERYNYNPETGELRWKIEPSGNTKIGELVGSYESSGYLRTTIGKKHYKVHRICYLIHYGEWPDEIDHVNRVKDDNRICNLRSVTHQENMKNRPKQTNNTSGVTGVYYNKAKGKWCAQIGGTKGRRRYLGYFDTMEEAVAARKKAEAELGFMEPN